MKKNASHEAVGRSPRKVKRREFLGRTAAAGAAVATGGAIFGGHPPAFAQSRSVHYLQWSSFIKDADVVTRDQAMEFEKASGIKMTVEFINQNDMNARATAAIESGQGADVMLMINNEPHLFAKGIENHDKLVAELLSDDPYPFVLGATTVDGVPRGVPYFIIGNANVYRKDVFDELGISRTPDTWDEYLEVGKKLKNINLPVGQTLGHTFGDAPSFAYPLMWSFGGMEVDEGGKVAVDSKETHMSIEFMKEFWDAACDPGGLAWDDTSNNRAFMGQTIGATLNGASIYFVARRNPDKYPGFADKLRHFLNPQGPGGRFHQVGPRTLCIMNYSKNKEAAAEYIRYVMEDSNFDPFLVANNGYINGVAKKWENHDMWDSDPAITIFKSMPAYGRAYGHAGPWNRESGEVAAKYIIVDMYARAVQGESPQKAAAWAAKELTNVYG
jgi:multiple sugar transport system substrate-binding protein